MKTSLIDKVYDVYEDRDFSSVSNDNLNPLRDFNEFEDYYHNSDNRNNKVIYDAVMNDSNRGNMLSLFGDGATGNNLNALITGNDAFESFKNDVNSNRGGYSGNAGPNRGGYSGNAGSNRGGYSGNLGPNRGGYSGNAGSPIGDGRAGNTLGSSVLSDTINRKRRNKNNDIMDEAALIAKVRERYDTIKESLSRITDIDLSFSEDDPIPIPRGDSTPPYRPPTPVPPPKSGPDPIPTGPGPDPYYEPEPEPGPTPPGPGPNPEDPDYPGPGPGPDPDDPDYPGPGPNPEDPDYPGPGPGPDPDIPENWPEIPDIEIDPEPGPFPPDIGPEPPDPDYPGPDPDDDDTDRNPEPPNPTPSKRGPTPPGPGPTPREEDTWEIIGSVWPDPFPPKSGPDPTPWVLPPPPGLEEKQAELYASLPPGYSPSPIDPIDCDGIASAVNRENEEDADIDGDDSDFAHMGAEDALIAGKDQQTNRDELQNALQDREILSCALKELVFLKIILTIVKIISTLRILASIILNAAYTVMDIVQLAAGAWLNYSNIAKIANKIITRVVAIIVQVIAVLAQKLWEALNLDCIDNISMSLLGQIREAIAGVLSIKSMTDPNAIKFGIGDIIASIQESWADIMENTKNAFDWSQIKNGGKAIVQGLQAGGKTIVDAAKDATVGRALSTWNTTVSEMQEVMAEAGKLLPSAADVSNAMTALKVDLK